MITMMVIVILMRMTTMVMMIMSMILTCIVAGVKYQHSYDSYDYDYDDFDWEDYDHNERFWDTEVAERCWDFSKCGCPFQPWWSSSSSSKTFVIIIIYVIIIVIKIIIIPMYFRPLYTIDILMIIMMVRMRGSEVYLRPTAFRSDKYKRKIN